MLAIGIDISKATFHAALDDATVKTFTNSHEGLALFLDTLEKRGHIPANTTVGVESTGVYHLLLCVTLKKVGYTILLINPLESHRFLAAQSLRRRKTDAIDARLIRTMVERGIGRPFIETDDVLTLKALIADRDCLVRMRRMLLNQAEARMVREQALMHELYDPSLSVQAALEVEIRMLERHLARYEPETQKLLRSIPGIGAISAAYLVAHIGDITRFSSPEKLVAYVGLDCRVHESGTSIKGKGFISKRGNGRLRTVLYNAAFMARQTNPFLKAYFEKKIREGKHYVSALVAVERKLLHIIYAVWTRGTPFEERLI